MQKRMQSVFYGLSVLCCMAGYTGFSQINLTDKLPLDPSVKTGKLPNGLTYYIRQNKKPEKKAELRLVVNAGSILEDEDEQGLAHFTEHMAFNGSTHYKKNDLVGFLQTIGVQFGADLNAATGFDETIYILPIPLGDTGNLRKGLTVLQDWAGGVSFDNDQIDGERGVVLEESRSGKGADDRMFRKVFPLQYQGSKYALRIPIGKDSILKNAKYDVVKRFYKQYYRPDLEAVIVVGDIDPAATEKLIRSYFGALKNPANERPRINATVSARQKDEAIVVSDKEATNFAVEVNYPMTPSKLQVTVGDYRNDLVKDLFLSLLNQRLHELTEGAKPPFLFATTGFNTYARGYEGFSAYAIAGKGGPDTALQVLVGEIERVKKYGFTETELERGRKQMLAGMQQAYNNRDKTESASFVDEYVRNFLQHEPSPGIVKEYEYLVSFLPGIKLTEVNTWANRLKEQEHIFVSLQGPADSGITLPDNKALLAEALQARKAPVQPYEEKTASAALIDTKLQPGTIVKEKKDSLPGVTELDYANGVKVFLKPTDFKNDEIIMSAFHKGGLSGLPLADKYSANYSTAVVRQMGVGNFSPTELEKFLAGKTVAVAPSLSGLNAGISGQSSIKDFETMLQLTYLYLTAPRKDEALFNGWRDKQKSQMQFAMADPQTAFVDTVYQVLYQNNPLAPIAIPKPAFYDSIDLDRSVSIYKQLFGDATDFNFFFVGSFEVEKIKPLLSMYLGSLASTGKPAVFTDNGVRKAKGDIHFAYRKGTDSKSLIFTIYSGDVPYSEDLALKAEALKEVLNIKIIENLREKLGAIYSGNFYGGVNKLPYNNYTFVLNLPCGPENVEKLLKAANDEIDSAKQTGIRASYLDKVKKTWLEQHKVEMKENNYWAGKLQGLFFQGGDAHLIDDYEKRINALTPEDLKATANLLFDGKNRIQAVLYPEK